MSQPEWEEIKELSADTWRVYRDKTGVYVEELEWADEIEDASHDERFQVFRVTLDRLKMVEDENGEPVMVPIRYEPSWSHAVSRYREWYDRKPGDLKGIADTAGRTVADMRAALCSESARDRAFAYMDIAGCHGWENFDSYPLRMSGWELNRRWGDDQTGYHDCPCCGETIMGETELCGDCRGEPRRLLRRLPDPAVPRMRRGGFVLPRRCARADLGQQLRSTVPERGQDLGGETKYLVMGRYKGCEAEEVDEADTRSEAEWLAGEYKIAFGRGWDLWVEKR